MDTGAARGKANAALLGRLPRHRCPNHKGVQAGFGNSTRALETVLGLCRRLGIPISVHKTEGPSVVLILGVELDTQKMEVRRLKRDQEVERLLGMLQKGAAVLSGPAATCMLLGEARAVLSPENDRSVRHGERNALHD